jgi:hypothetical protein
MMVMNKGKLKRGKKELDRLFSQGHYGEFLLMVENDGLSASYPRETGAAWRLLVDSAFTSPDGMLAFLELRPRLTTVPDLADLRLLSLIQAFLDGRRVKEDVGSLKNLSSTPQVMARLLVEWDESQEIIPEMEALFTRFVLTPEEIHCEDMTVATRLFFELFGGSVNSLAHCLETLQNTKGNGPVAARLDEIDLGVMAEVDQVVAEKLEAVPEGIRKIFLAPFLWQLSRIYETCTLKDPALPLALASVTPYLTSHLTGERWDELEQLLYEDDLSDRYEEDPRYVRKMIAGAQLPEKIRLLRTLERTLGNIMAKEGDHSRSGQTSGPDLAKRIRADYLYLYIDILAHIGRDRLDISPREQEELLTVMGELLDRAFVTFVSDPRQCDEFLQAVALAGLLDTKRALTSLLIARITGNRTLRESAERALTTLPPPVKGDIHWIFKFFGFLSYPTITALAPVIGRLTDHEPLLDLLADLIAIQVTRHLVENQLLKFSRLDIFQALKKGSTRDCKQEMVKFRGELGSFRDIESFDHLFLLAESYPEGYVTEDGFKKVLIARHASSGIVEIIERTKHLPPPPPGMTAMDSRHSSLFGMELRESLELFKQHFEELRPVPLENLATLVEILERAGTRTVDPDFLARFWSLLQERCKGGEDEALSLAARIEVMIPVSPENQQERE